MLTTLDLNRILKNVKEFGGTWSSNTLPLVTKKPIKFIINLDPSYKEGSHWVAVKFNKNGTADYFDSYGRPPFGYILTFIERFAPKGYTFSKNKYQDDYSTTCGYFCILYILLNQERFHKVFQKCQTIKNEQKLLQIIKNFID